MLSLLLIILLVSNYNKHTLGVEFASKYLRIADKYVKF